METVSGKKRAGWLLCGLVSVLSLAAATGLGLLFGRAGFPETNIVLLYILAVLAASTLTKGYIYGVLTSVAANFVFNYFFTDPYYTLNVNDPSYLITFLIMTITALVTSALTSRSKLNALEATERERETQALYQLTSRLTEAKDARQVASIVVKAVSSLMDCRAACICFDEEGNPERVFVQQADGERQVQRRLDDPEGLRHRMEHMRTAFDEDGEFMNWPIYGEKRIDGVIRIPKEDGKRFGEEKRRFLFSLIECTALAMDRITSVKNQMRSRQEMMEERYRGNLLRAISHDLRTPLSGIMGTSEMIMDMTGKEDPRYGMAQGILKDADWLHSLVENILSLTRIQEGRMTIRKEYEAVEEVVGGAAARMASRAPEYEIAVQVPDEVLMVPMDARLIMQVLINLLDNAVKHTPADREISVTVEKNVADGCAVFRVEDEGEGISPTDLPNIFKTFYTSQIKSSDVKKGIGLGLPICESIVKAHGGSICAANRTDGPGAVFTFTLPLTEEKRADEEDGEAQAQERQTGEDPAQECQAGESRAEGCRAGEDPAQEH